MIVKIITTSDDEDNTDHKPIFQIEKKERVNQKSERIKPKTTNIEKDSKEQCVLLLVGIMLSQIPKKQHLDSKSDEKRLKHNKK